MDLSRLQNLHYSKYFKHIVPLSIHPLYTKSLEFSDKIILPGSTCKDLIRNKFPFPPQLLISPERPQHSKIYCTVLEFSAEEDFIYLPYWMLRELGYKVLNPIKGINRNIKAGYGVTVSLLDLNLTKIPISYMITKCQKIEYYLETEHNSEDVKIEISKYMFVREDSEMSVLLGEHIVIIRIVRIEPGPIAILQGDFWFFRVTELPKKEKRGKEESTNTEVSEKPEKFPIFPAKLPKFLIDIMKKRAKKLEEKRKDNEMQAEIANHKKNNSCALECANLFPSLTSTPELLEKFLISENKNIEVGDSIGLLPPVYHRPIKIKLNSPQLLTIIIPELSPQLSVKRKVINKLPRYSTTKKPRSITPLTLKKIKIDGNSHTLNLENSYNSRYAKGINLFYSSPEHLRH